MQDEGLLLFDGDCSFCNRAIQFILKRDKKKYFSFASLQGFTGHEMKKRYSIPNHFDSIILIQDGTPFDKSTAVLRICKKLKPFYPFLYFFILIPRPIRNMMYDWIAKNRKLFQKQSSTCILPSKEDKDRFRD